MHRETKLCKTTVNIYTRNVSKNLKEKAIIHIKVMCAILSRIGKLSQ